MWGSAELRGSMNLELNRETSALFLDGRLKPPGARTSSAALQPQHYVQEQRGRIARKILYIFCQVIILFAQNSGQSHAMNYWMVATVLTALS